LFDSKKSKINVSRILEKTLLTFEVRVIPLYEKVENKVIFGDFESDWFDQEFGLKQGCILFPTLFPILMTDLANMLEYTNKEVFLKIYIGMQ
jgi:hypothetical protein